MPRPLRRWLGPLLVLLVAGPARAQPLGGRAYAPGVDVERYRFALTLSDATDRIEGEATLEVLFTADTLTVLPLDLVGEAEGRGMRVAAVAEGGRPLAFVHRGGRLLVSLGRRPRAGERRTFAVAYAGVPADGLIVGTNRHGARTFFGDNWPERARHWLPTVDHPSDKARVEWAVTAPAHYQVVGNGRLVEEADLRPAGGAGGGLRLTRWVSDDPLPTKVMVIGAAPFAVEHRGLVAGVPVEAWVYPEDRAAGFADVALGDRVLRVFSELLGPFPYDKLAHVQSTTRYGGMENAAAIFYAENAFGTARMEGLIAHETAHQWFGDAVTEADWPHLWLSEGFATYLTHVYHELAYGRDRLADGLARDRDAVLVFVAEHPDDPLVDTTFADPNELLTTSPYQRGAWVLHMLRRRLGDAPFFEGLRTFYARYRDGNAATDDLRRVMEEVSGDTLGAFFRQWTRNAHLPRLEAEWRYDAAARQVVLDVRQVQDDVPFVFPLDVGLTLEGSALPFVHTVEVDNRGHTFTFPAATAPLRVTLDPDVWLLAALPPEAPGP